MTASTVTALEIVSGIITTKAWICWRSVLARLISWPVWALVVEREVQALEVGEQAVAQVGLDPAGLAEGEVAAEPVKMPDDDGGDGDDERPAPQRRHVVGLDALVDGPLRRAGRR